MDPTPLVQRKLEQGHLCLACIEAGLVQDWLRSSCYVAVVQGSSNSAIFVYSSKRIPCFSTSDLTLESVLPLDSDVRCHAETPKVKKFTNANNDELHDDIILALSGPRGRLLLEMNNDTPSQLFLACIIEAQRKTTAGVPGATFAWTEKYLTPNVATSSQNPFANDIFDPLNQLGVSSPADQLAVSTPVTQLDTSKSVSDGSDVRDDSPNAWSCDNDPKSSQCNGAPVMSRFTDNFSDMNVSSFGKTDSLLSLDSLLTLSTEETGLTVDSIQRQLGLGPGAELPVGSKPVTARETFVQHYMMERQTEFTDTHTFRIMCATWNVNGMSPVESLYPWLAPDELPPDIYAIGFQELDLGKEALFFSESSKEHEWRRQVEKFLHPHCKYVKVKLIRLVGIMLIVYVKVDHVKHVSFIDAETVATGIMGFMGNKGGVAVRFSIHNTSLCFICSHLAAHQDEFERRNQDYRDIEAKMRFKTFIPPLVIGEHDMVFWLGDLNYRINMADINEVKNLIGLDMYQKLLPHDQLILMLGETDVFRGYTEGEINFRPTYRYDPGTNNWDTSEKCRQPAWCDRILWKGGGIRQLYYTSQQVLRISDHKPVNALFEAAIRVIDEGRYKKVYEDVMKKLDRLENEFLPQVKLDKTEFYFRNVKFIEPQKEVLTIANTGQVPVQFEFINKLDDAQLCKAWMNVEPFKSAIMPGESCEVTLEIYVDEASAWTLNCGKDSLDDIMVLHLHGGKDLFIPVSGNYIPSSFGSSLEALVQTHKPIRDVPVGNLVDLESPGSLQRFLSDSSGTTIFAVPKEIWRMIDHIYTHGMMQADLFQQPGLHSEILRIRDCLDTGQPTKIPGSIHSVAESLLIFLESFPDPVVPTAVYTRCINSCNSFTVASQIISQLDDCHKNLFKYLIAFLRELLKQSASNNLDVKLLASLFGKPILRPPKPFSRKSEIVSSRERQAQFIYLFLTNEYGD